MTTPAPRRSVLLFLKSLSFILTSLLEMWVRWDSNPQLKGGSKMRVRSTQPIAIRLKVGCSTPELRTRYSLNVFLSSSLFMAYLLFSVMCTARDSNSSLLHGTQLCLPLTPAMRINEKTLQGVGRGGFFMNASVDSSQQRMRRTPPAIRPSLWPASIRIPINRAVLTTVAVTVKLMIEYSDESIVKFLMKIPLPTRGIEPRLPQ